MIHCHCAFLLKSAVKETLSQEIHLQISGCCWYTLPNICNIASTAVMMVGYLPRTIEKTLTLT